MLSWLSDFAVCSTVWFSVLRSRTSLKINKLPIFPEITEDTNFAYIVSDEGMF